MKSLYLPTACLTIVALLGAASISRADDMKPSAADKTFVMKAAQGGMAEVDLGKMASEKGTSQDVKDFGAKMVADHTQNNSDLKSLASSKGIMLPEMTDAHHKMMEDKMDKMAAGQDWDMDYVKGMVAGHEKMDKMMSDEAANGTDPDLKAFAAKTDETVKMHLSMIKDIQSKMMK